MPRRQPRPNRRRSAPRRFRLGSAGLFILRSQYMVRAYSTLYILYSTLQYVYFTQNWLLRSSAYFRLAAAAHARQAAPQDRKHGPANRRTPMSIVCRSLRNSRSTNFVPNTFSTKLYCRETHFSSTINNTSKTVCVQRIRRPWQGPSERGARPSNGVSRPHHQGRRKKALRGCQAVI